MLHDDSRISDQWPEIIRTNARVSLEMIEEGFGIGVIIRVCCLVLLSAGHLKEDT